MVRNCCKQTIRRSSLIYLLFASATLIFFIALSYSAGYLFMLGVMFSNAVWLVMGRTGRQKKSEILFKTID